MVVGGLAERVAARVGNIEHPFVEAYAFRLPPHLTGDHHILGLEVYLRHITTGESLRATLVGVRRDIEIPPVATHAAVVGHVFRCTASRAVGVDILYDVGPIDGDGYQRVVDMQDVVWRVTNL